MASTDPFPAPTRFASPGMLRALERLGHAEPLKDVPPGANRMALSHVVEREGLLEQELFFLISEDTGVPSVLHREIVDGAQRTAKFCRERCNRDVLFSLRCVPMDFDTQRSQLVLAMADPFDAQAIRELEFALQCSVVPKLAPERSIISVLAVIFDQSTELLDQLNQLELRDATDRLEALTELSDEDSDAESMLRPVVRMVDSILTAAAERGASDIHFEPYADHLLVRLRLDGVMSEYLSLPSVSGPYIVARLKILSGMDITVRARPQDGRMTLTASGSAVDVRVSTIPTGFGEKVVLRLLTSQRALELEQLGMSSVVRRQVLELLASRDRMVLVTGPTGSGKTTTLYAALRAVSSGRENVVTIEDPVEIRLPGITQMQVDEKAGVTFASGLRAILRQDPDIVLVGEMRDLESAAIACEAAQTGHLVLSTLHTNTAPAAVVRLLDLGIEPFVLASALGGVIAQRLVRRLCPSCAQPPTAAEAEAINKHRGIKTDKLRVSRGCVQCNETGYRGRIAVYSVLRLDEPLAKAIANKASENELQQLARRNGYRSLLDAGFELVEQGITSLDELQRVLGSDAGQRGDISAEGALVLILDDDARVHELLGSVLQRSGYRVIEASDVTSALAAVRNQQPDLVLCDLRIPSGREGLDFVRRLRADLSFKQVPVLMLTSDDSDRNQVDLLEAGASGFLSKSASLRVVLAHVKRALGSA